MNHTKEPWIIDSDRRRGANLIRGDKAKMVAWTIYFDNGSKTELANAQRIVACVNACADVEDKKLKLGYVKELEAENAELHKVLLQNGYNAKLNNVKVWEDV